MHGVSLLQLVPENGKAPRSPSWIQGLQESDPRGAAQVFLKWVPNAEADFLHYRLWRKRAEENEHALLCGNSSLNTSVYTDTEVRRGCTYHYRLQAVNACGVSSGYSEELVVAVS